MSMPDNISISYDSESDTVTLFGVRYAANLFRVTGFAPAGRWLRIVKRENGYVTVFQTTPENDKVFDKLSDFKEQP